MPLLFDPILAQTALQDQAVPILEALTGNSNLRNRGLRRFERDDPPPYTSSTESEEVDYVLPQSGPLPRSMIEVMTPPLSNDELEDLVRLWHGVGQPESVFQAEADMELERVEQYLPSWMYVGGPEAHVPHNIIARHIIKRRWEKLGVWNPAWGIPGRLKSQPKDNTITWKWWWEPQDDDGARRVTQSRFKRALFLRQNLRRGENNPVPPRSHLEPGADVSQAESFLISRPWYVKRIENIEEYERWHRIHTSERVRFEYNYTKQVREWWKERGDWREVWGERGNGKVTSWKWRHESPSPEPEDLTAIDGLNKYELPKADFDFTLSEIDALEEFNAPSPRTSPPIRPPRQSSYSPGRLFLPAYAVRQGASQEEVEEPRQRENEGPVHVDPVNRQGTSQEEQGEPLLDMGALLQRQPRRPVKANSVWENSRPLRRSARIANMKRKAEESSSPSPPSLPSKKTRKGKTTAKAQAVVEPDMAPKASKPRLRSKASRSMPAPGSGTRHERGPRTSEA